MAIETQKFIRKPLYVEAVQITRTNFDAVVAWCQGEVTQDDVPGRGRSKKYIKLDVHQPKNVRQTKGKVGDWILKTEKGYKIYTDKAFHESFHLPEEDHRVDEEELISASDEVVPGVTVGEAVRLLRHHADMQTEVGPGVEVVPATPETIAQAVNENQTALSIQNGAQAEQVQNVEDVPEQETVEPAAVEGKRVLSVEEQKQMDAEEIRNLIQSGEAVLAQDIAV
jgi:hypothetical protein